MRVPEKKLEDQQILTSQHMVLGMSLLHLYNRHMEISKQVANIQNLSGVKKDDQRTEAQSGDKNVQVNKADNDAGAQGNCSVS